MKEKIFYIATAFMGLVGMLNFVLSYNLEKYQTLFEYTNMLFIFTVIVYIVSFVVFVKRKK